MEKARDKNKRKRVDTLGLIIFEHYDIMINWDKREIILIDKIGNRFKKLE